VLAASHDPDALSRVCSHLLLTCCQKATRGCCQTASSRQGRCCIQGAWSPRSNCRSPRVPIARHGGEQSS
jgi:hypothetical protein